MSENLLLEARERQISVGCAVACGGAGFADGTAKANVICRMTTSDGRLEVDVFGTDALLVHAGQMSPARGVDARMSDTVRSRRIHRPVLAF